MFGPSRAGRQRRRSFSRTLGHVGAALALALACAIGASACGFPDYGFDHAVTGGAAGASGMGAASGSGAGGSSGFTGASGEAGTSGGAAGSGGSDQGGAGNGGQSGAAGEAGAGGEAGAACVFPEPAPFPGHCFDTTLNSGETGLNCGGPCAPCSGTEACTVNSDCASNVCTSGKCSQILSVAYKGLVTDPFTSTIKFSLLITYLDKATTALKDLRIRYYFNHDGVAEPVIALHTQAQLDPGNSQRDISSAMSAEVYRLPPGPTDGRGFVTDSYLEIQLSDNSALAAGTTLNLTLDIDAGSSDTSSQFQQALNYSYLAGGPLENDWVTVYRKDQLLWGVPPPLRVLPACAFVTGVNLHGPAVISGEQRLQASSAANVLYSGATFDTAPASVLLPLADLDTTTMLHTGFALGSSVAMWSVPKGKYWGYAWLTSDASMSFGQLLIQDTAADRFYGKVPSNGAGWARMGPYAIDASGGSVKLNGTGTVNLAGVELYDVAP